MSLKQYVCGFMFVDDHVALIRKLRPEWQFGRLNGVGGKVELDEDPADAIVREFEEEACLKTTRHDWRRLCTLYHASHSQATNDYIVIFYVARSSTRDGIESTEDEQIEWHSVERLPTDVIQNLTWLIPLALDPAIKAPVYVVDEGEN